MMNFRLYIIRVAGDGLIVLKRIGREHFEGNKLKNISFSFLFSQLATRNSLTRNLSYIIALISCHIFLNCDEGMNEPPSPADETTVYYGDIYIACDNSPHYRFSLDSLILNCNATDTTDFFFPMGIQVTTTTCLYDGNFGLAASASDYDFSVSRADMQPVFMDPAVGLTPIPYAIVNGDTIQIQTYPFYSAYEANWADNRLELYIYNAYQGGCLHDMVVWRLERSE